MYMGVVAVHMIVPYGHVLKVKKNKWGKTCNNEGAGIHFLSSIV